MMNFSDDWEAPPQAHEAVRRWRDAVLEFNFAVAEESIAELFRMGATSAERLENEFRAWFEHDGTSSAVTVLARDPP